MWAGMWHGGKTTAIMMKGTMTGDRYLNEVLLPIVVPLARDEDLIFQDDNARPHRSTTVVSTVTRLGIETLDWPARSPDLSPIEHAWDELGRRVRERYATPPPSLDVLAERLREQWENLENAFIQKLCDSIPSRLNECLRARGGHIRY